MTDATKPERIGRSPRVMVAFALILVLVELTAIGTFFKHFINFECLANWPPLVCRGVSRSLVGVYCVLGVLVLVRMLRPAPMTDLIQNAGERLWPLGLNLTGVALALTPFWLLSGATGAAEVLPSLAAWAVAMCMMLGGAALFIAPWPRWRMYWASEWTAVLPGIAAGFAAPWVSVRLQPIWSIDWIADNTFAMVSWIMRNAGYDDLYADAESKVIGSGEFFIKIANVCSGVEGIALVTLFVSLYLWLFRKDLRFPLAFVLFPLGIATSVVFNILRISVLLFIGLEGNPELAVGGFHSHAGWMMFTLVALGIIALAQTVPMLRASSVDGEPRADMRPTFLGDPVVAQILPFIVFMLSALVASTLSQTPSAVYPIRVVLMIAVLALMLPFYIRLPWRVDPVAVAVGAVIGVYWVLIPVADADDVAPYGALTGVALILWFVARGVGTVVLVPLIEELFFRGYLEQRLRLGSGIWWKIGAAVVTAVLFAALHGRWAEAFVAGLLLSWAAGRRNNITDAIIAHAVANAIIYGVALWTGQMHII